MISLVKNELVKIFHKKGLYILGIIVLGLLLLNIVISLNYEEKLLNGLDDLYYQVLEDGLDNYDMDDTEELSWYIRDKAEIDTYSFLKEYDYLSPEYYFIDNTGKEVIENLLNAQYMSKDEEEIKIAQDEYDKFVNKLNNFDWQEDLKEEKEELEKTKDVINNQLKDASEGEDTSNIEQELVNINYQLEGINYRLNDGIAPSYNANSTLVDTYVSSALQYDGMKKDEDLYSDRGELINKREVEESYYTSKYKLDNKIYNEGYETTQAQVISMFSSVDIFILIALFIIIGGIVSEEFNKGTIKQLLVRPHSRVKVLTSKIVAGVIALIIFSFVYFIANLISFWIVNGEVGSLLQTVVVYDFNLSKVVEYSTFTYCLLNGLSILPIFAIIFMFVIFMGVITLNTTGAIVSGFGLYIASSIINGILPKKIVAFLPISCWDFRSYLFGGISSNQYASLGISVIISILTIFILSILAYGFFKRIDVKNQ